MSDYLNNIVSRTLRLGPVVQPRLASLFEPAPAGPASEPAMEVSETRATRETLQPPATPTYTPVQTNIEPRPRNESTGVVLHPAPATLVPGPTMPPPVLSLNHHAEDSREVVRDDNTDSTVASETPNNSTPLRLKPEVHIISSSKDREQIQPSTPPPTILTHAAAPAPLSPVRRVNTQAAVEAEAPESVVVTIGRVDVRAVFPSQPQPAPRSNRASPQAMSLDEYLKQRSEGRR